MLGAIYFLSGVTGLVYEVLWAKYLSLLFGGTALANTTVLATFLGGLALGGAWLGPRADRAGSPLAFYARLELGLAVLGLLPPFALPYVSKAYLAACATGLSPSSAEALRVLLAAAVLLPPTALMGATLPALGRHLADRGDSVGGAASRLYGVNSAGAVAGCLAAGYWMIPSWGLDFSTSMAAVGNLVCGVAALALAKRGWSKPAPVAAEGRGLAPELKALLWGGACVSGLVALWYEVGWIRLIGLVMGSSAYSFSAMLAGFITGIALGARLARARPLARISPYLAFGLAELAAGAVVALTVPFYDKLPFVVLIVGGLFNRVPATFYLFEAAKLLICLAVMLLPTALLGMTLPLAASALSERRHAARDLGRLWAFNTAGNVLGAVLGGLWLLPALGLQGLFGAGAAASLAVGVAIVATSEVSRRVKTAALGAAFLAFACALREPAWDKLMISRGDFRTPMASRYPDFKRYAENTARQSLVFYKDGREATVSVERDPRGALALKVNGKVDASSTADMANQMLIAHIPLLLKPRSKDVLIVGLGSGVTAGAALEHPVERVDVVEISPLVISASRYFAAFNHGALGDPRLRVTVDDAKSFIKTTPRLYDAVLSEPSNTWIAGVANLFTADFYEDARARLKPGGVFLQWFHLYEINDPTLQLVLRTFASAFSDVSLWETTPGEDLLIIGSNGPRRTDYRAMEREFAEPRVRADMERLGMKRLSTLLSLQSGEDRLVRAAAGDGPINEDRFPLLEYEAPKAFWLHRYANILSREDERVDPTLRQRLHEQAYLKARGRRMDDAERAEWKHYHAAANPSIAELAKTW